MSPYGPTLDTPTAPAPSVAVTLAISPPDFKIGTPVELSVTAISKASQPITIFTWQHIFNVQLAQQRGNFVGWDRDTGTKLPLHDMDVTPAPFNYTLGGPFDEYFVTLEPGQPFKLNSSFLLAYEPSLLPGHRYLIDIWDVYGNMSCWTYGRKEEVLDLPGQNRNGYWPSGGPIVLSLDEPVEFKVLPLDGWLDKDLLDRTGRDLRRNWKPAGGRRRKLRGRNELARDRMSAAESVVLEVLLPYGIESMWTHATAEMGMAGVSKEMRKRLDFCLLASPLVFQASTG
jgi:hypothetical protein